MNLLKKIFGSKKHTEAIQKTQEIILGADEKSAEVHKNKNYMTSELGKISAQARKVQKESERLNKLVDTAYMIAKSTGNMR